MGDFLNESYGKITMLLILFMTIVLIVGLIWGMSTLGPITSDGVDKLSNSIGSMSDIMPQDGPVNGTTAVQVTSHTIKRFNTLPETFAYIILISLIIGFFVVSYSVRSYPFLAFAWILIIAGLVFLCMFISNSYEQATNANPEAYTNWGTNHFIMLNLPYIVLGFGILSGIIIFMQLDKTEASQEAVI